jgi:hypothetical protein
MSTQLLSTLLTSDFDALISTLETDSNQLIEWFRINKMQANPDKFQFLAVECISLNKTIVIDISLELVLKIIFIYKINQIDCSHTCSNR